MSSFQVLSDVHLEAHTDFSGTCFSCKQKGHRSEVCPRSGYKICVTNYIVPSAPILVLAGDIGSLHSPEYILEFLKSCSEHFDHVLYVLGNHEYYFKESPVSNTASAVHSCSMDSVLFNFKRLLKDPKNGLANVILLDRKIVRINGIHFAGATLWTDVSDLKKIPDYVRLGITKENYLDRHRRDLKWISRVCNKFKNTALVLITHHCPSKSFLPRNNFTMKNASMYATDLIDKFSENKNVSFWIFGHTHHNIDVTKNSTRYVTNQVGKKWDKCRIDKSGVFHIRGQSEPAHSRA
jgi:UDP-2,3-diacylglucosamine pyrophosphatase LpxH